MYQLTAAEAATVLFALSRGHGTESSDAGPPGIPTSTYYAARRKIYDAGWLTDRYLPDPWALDVAAVDFHVARPRPSTWSGLAEAWVSSPETVLLWGGSNVLLAVAYRRGREPPWIENGTLVSVTPESGSIPVYFDFSRLWSRFVRVDRETGYPRGLGERRDRPTRNPIPSLAELVQENREAEGAPLPARRWHSVSKLPRKQALLLERGLARSRTLLNLEAVPPFDDRCLGEVVIVSGAMRGGVSSSTILASLNNECRVSPLLLAEDGRRVLLVALGQLDAGASSRTRLPRASGNVAHALDELLVDLEVTTERTDGVRKLVDHRYDRLFEER
jgi:hypothetical protein